MAGRFLLISYILLSCALDCHFFLLLISLLVYRQRLIILVSFIIPIWLGSLGTALRAMTDYWFMNLCQKEAWKIIFFEVSAIYNYVVKLWNLIDAPMEKYILYRDNIESDLWCKMVVGV